MWKKIPCYWKWMTGSICILILLNTAALSRGFCDWYVTYIFPIWVATYGRFSGLFPFSLGECMIIAAIILGVIAVVCGICLILFRKRERFKSRKKYIIKYYKVCLAICMVAALMLTMNFRILYRCSPMEVNADFGKRVYSVQELEILRNYLVEQINRMAEQVERGENAEPIYIGDLQQEAQNAMRNLAKEYPRLSGYYPNAKPIQNSRLMSMTGIAGVYFAFSLEANYNNEMYSTVYPETICHEYAHLKGYILEDEANFWGYLACVESDDAFFQYSGYMSAFDYVEGAYLDSVDAGRYDRQIQLSKPAAGDCYVWLDEKAREEIYDSDDNTAAMAENLKAAREVVHDASLKLSGVEDGIASYDRVTELLLQYYDGKLY